jgi:hypothetical protein
MAGRGGARTIGRVGKIQNPILENSKSDFEVFRDPLWIFVLLWDELDGEDWSG